MLISMDILGIGTPEFIFILIIILILFGPRRLIEITTGVGKIIRSLRRITQDFMTAWQREVGTLSDLEELQKARQELKKTREELRQTRMNVSSHLSATQKDVSSSSSSATTSSSGQDLSSAKGVPEATLPSVTQEEGGDEELLPQPDRKETSYDE